MRSFITTALAVSLLAPAAASAAVPPTGVPPASGTYKAAPTTALRIGAVVPGRYIVRVRSARDPRAESAGLQPTNVYRGGFRGFSARLTSGELRRVRRDRDVVAVEPVRVVTGAGYQTADLPWGLDRIDQRSRPLNGGFGWSATGAGVNAYIIDSGIQTNHPQFGNRAIADFDNVGDGYRGQDCYGHGTHVAGTLGGSTYGVAKGVWLRSVRTLDCRNSGDTAKLIEAVNWVRANFRRPAVATISISGPRNAGVNQAVTALANAGVFVSVAAGNSGTDACASSPASAPGTYTVAASDANDNRAVTSSWQSNWGRCVDTYAPGLNVKSAYPGSQVRVWGGTSMAAPLAAGVVAQAKSAYGDGYSTAAWVQWMNNNATTNVIGGNIAGTPNRLLFKGGL